MKDWLDTLDARRASQRKYDKNHTMSISLKLNHKTDADIIQWLQKQTSRQGAIKALIRQDIAQKPIT